MIAEPNKLDVVPHPVLADYYGEADSRRKKVDEMFDTSAVHYDWITDMMSFGSGRWYRHDALKRAGLEKGMKLLDVGAGTGVVSYAGQQIVGEEGLVVALDPSKGMLTEAKKLGVSYAVQGLGEMLPYPDDTFDMLSMGFALRHVADLKLAFEEYNRVLKPGGKILLLEITRSDNPIAAFALKVYMKYIIPTVTRIFRRSPEAQELMQYYWDTTNECVRPDAILGALTGAGVSNPERNLVLGLFSEYTGVKPSKA